MWNRSCLLIDICIREETTPNKCPYIFKILLLFKVVGQEEGKLEHIRQGWRYAITRSSEESHTITAQTVTRSARYWQGKTIKGHTIIGKAVVITSLVVDSTVSVHYMYTKKLSFYNVFH